MHCPPWWECASFGDARLCLERALAPAAANCGELEARHAAQSTTIAGGRDARSLASSAPCSRACIVKPPARDDCCRPSQSVKESMHVCMCVQHSMCLCICRPHPGWGQMQRRRRGAQPHAPPTSWKDLSLRQRNGEWWTEWRVAFCACVHAKCMRVLDAVMAAASPAKTPPPRPDDRWRQMQMIPDLIQYLISISRYLDSSYRYIDIASALVYYGHQDLVGLRCSSTTHTCATMLQS